MDNPAGRKIPHSRVAAKGRAGKWTRERATAGAFFLVIGWYLLAYLIARPLADAPVVDSWVYSHAVEFFRQTGSIRFAGYSQATPALLVLYGAAWSRVFGGSAASLDVSVAVLGAIAGLLFYALARRCGAAGWPAVLATALLIANPCYMFMSFSFMTEIPFIALLLGAHLAFAQARRGTELRWFSISALVAFLAFMVRPFAAAAIAGSAAAVLIHDRVKRPPEALWRTVVRLAPFAGGLALCALGWVWLTRFNPQPWMLRRSEHRLQQLFAVSPAAYVRAGLIGPIFYLGVVLSPLALPHLLTASWRKGFAIGASLLVAALVLMRLAPGPPATPELSCFAGWRNALLLRGLPNHFSWGSGWAQWSALTLGAFGAAGIVLAVTSLPGLPRRGALAVIVTAIIYWLGLIPLWLFNDRYYLVMVPAGCLLLVLAPPRGISGRTVAVAGVIILGLISIAGVDDYQRGLAAIVAARDALERSGVPRSDIDAGYSLNGGDLYYESPLAIEHEKMAPQVPMITSSELAPYAIAGAPVDGTRILRRIRWPGPLGCGRQIYILERIPAAKN